MKARMALVLLLLLAVHPCSGHRMMMGYQVNEVQVTALYTTAPRLREWR